MADKIRFIMRNTASMYQMDMNIHLMDKTADIDIFPFGSETVSLTDEELSDIKKAIEQLHLKSWRNVYRKKNVMDGTRWYLEMWDSIHDQCLLKVVGHSIYPENWANWINICQNLADKSGNENLIIEKPVTYDIMKDKLLTRLFVARKIN